MGGVDCAALTALLVDALKMLAAPASAQIEYLIEHRVDEDELALQLDDVLPAVVSNFDVPDDAHATLSALDAKLDSMSGQHNARLWTDEALHHADEWSTVRHLAAEALAKLGGSP